MTPEERESRIAELGRIIAANKSEIARSAKAAAVHRLQLKSLERRMPKLRAHLFEGGPRYPRDTASQRFLARKRKLS